MTGSKSGSLTIFLALSMMVFLTFCLVLTEGVRLYFLKTKARQAMELAEFSVLSEYQYELLSQYGVFFLDLDYEQGREHTGLLEQRFGDYLSQNAEEITTADLKIEEFQRATDQGGMPFFRQAVESVKVKSGYKVLEELGISAGLGESVDLGKLLEENTGAASALLGEYVDEEGEALFSISLPNVSFPSVQALTEAVFGSESMLSLKSINLEERLLKRSLSVGNKENGKFGLVDTQLFHTYIFEHFYHYGAKSAQIWRNALEYQLEYIIAGEESDQKNLENIMWRIFLMRAGGNYLLYHTDSQKLAQAEGEATALVGITGNAFFIEVVKEILLISRAIEDGIQETKAIFAGGKVPVYGNGSSGGIEMGYEQYLYLFLSTTDQKQKIYRSMDLIELEIREKSGYQNFRLNHCTDCFQVDWTWQADSIFGKFGFLEGGVFENTIRRKSFYEM